MNKVEEFLSLAVVKLEDYEKMNKERIGNEKERMLELLKKMTDDEFKEVIKKVPNIYAKMQYTEERKKLKNNYYCN